MRITFLQHVPFEGTGNVGRWAESRGHEFQCIRPNDDRPLPSTDQFDWLIVVGGLMSSYEHDEYSWLVAEKELIRETIDRGKLFFGICFGAQMAADVLGGEVRAHEHKEVGWWPVELTEEGKRSVYFKDLSSPFMAFQWHGDTFSIPPGAVRLAESEACANQAFQYGERVLGVQFHPDYSAGSIERLIENCGPDLVAGPYVQDTADMLPQTERVEQTRRLLYHLLDTMEAIGAE